MNATELRRELHAWPELSGQEAATARRLKKFFASLRPDLEIGGIGGTGGNGIAFAFGTTAGPTVMLRAELDALPIAESNATPHRSRIEGVSHKCGHDGHMAILAEAAARLAARRPERGRVVFLFQPAEETGAGAKAVVEDPAFERIRPDFAFGLHNVPGYPAGRPILRDGTFSCASRGLRVRLEGRPAHAAQPETGASPARALAALIERFDRIPADIAEDGELCFATVVGANTGGPDFGIAPGVAEFFATPRSETDATMQRLVAYAECAVHDVARRDGLSVTLDYRDVFDATVNTPRGMEIVREAFAGLEVVEATEPFRWSEDFGRFTQVGEGAFFGLGAGFGIPDLHNRDYDFPDGLIETGADLFLRIVARVLDGDGA